MAATDFDKGYLKGFHKGYLQGYDKGFTKGRFEKGNDTHSQGQDDIPRAGASASSQPMTDNIRDLLDGDKGGEGKGKARNRDRSRSRDAEQRERGKGEGKKQGVGVRRVKEVLEELGYEYYITGRAAQTPPDMTESELEALRAEILETETRNRPM